MTALDLAADRPTPGVCDLRAAVIDVAAGDAYAARDVLGHPYLRSHMTHEQHQAVADVLAAANLGVGSLPQPHADALTSAVQRGEDLLRVLLATPARGNG
ncbi:hypothetical protein [Nonomuraea indica]|uniref:Uncharacterized protein n=1 Tax=Nonomuraea indica TaxID=1581193 RepID=A0ABW8ADU9_9ACTN